MGMHLSAYVVMGIKKTRQEWKGEGIDTYYIQEDHPGLSAISGEGNDDEIVGKILAKTDEYSEQVATELAIPSVMDLSADLEKAGIKNCRDDIKVYLYGVWM